MTPYRINFHEAINDLEQYKSLLETQKLELEALLLANKAKLKLFRMKSLWIIEDRISSYGVTTA